MVVSGGSQSLALEMSSNPTTETSRPGTRPSWRRPMVTPKATMSWWQTTAVSGARAISRRMPSDPAAMVDSVGSIQASSGWIPAATSALRHPARRSSRDCEPGLPPMKPIARCPRDTRWRAASAPPTALSTPTWSNDSWMPFLRRPTVGGACFCQSAIAFPDMWRVGQRIAPAIMFSRSMVRKRDWRWALSSTSTRVGKNPAPSSTRTAPAVSSAKKGLEKLSMAMPTVSECPARRLAAARL